MKDLETAERWFRDIPSQERGSSLCLAVEYILTYLRATASPPPHVEEEKAAGEAEPDDAALLFLADDAGRAERLKFKDFPGGMPPSADIRAGRRALYRAGKASAAREVERLRKRISMLRVAVDGFGLGGVTRRQQADDVLRADNEAAETLPKLEPMPDRVSNEAEQGESED